MNTWIPYAGAAAALISLVLAIGAVVWRLGSRLERMEGKNDLSEYKANEGRNRVADLARHVAQLDERILSRLDKLDDRILALSSALYAVQADTQHQKGFLEGRKSTKRSVSR